MSSELRAYVFVALAGTMAFTVFFVSLSTVGNPAWVGCLGRR